MKKKEKRPDRSRGDSCSSIGPCIWITNAQPPGKPFDPRTKLQNLLGRSVRMQLSAGCIEACLRDIEETVYSTQLFDELATPPQPLQAE